MSVSRVAIVSCLALSIGCAHKAPDPVRRAHYPETITLYLARDAGYICNVNELTSPRFTLLPEPIRPDANGELRALAVCLTSGALKNDSVELVAQPDPTTSREEGRRRGMARAEAVKDFLIGEGVPGARLVVEWGDHREAATGAGILGGDRHADVVIVAR